ncbi:MAG: HAD-IA family hydrolase, partial [Nitrospinaceae bacterium]|nr:HAD family phosphatase [Nitrospinaceae bacterium]NIS87074.1 HAD family phosphatase [Nitrospinaceae bacterium]NIT83928.1 HAD family phosphatase [Nitrospinaceae bacterium]NIU98297.1 HAD-IA family hydrolase [Nitrospinaceae bacterium]NIY17337.1 HAD-IA family hydrolase [Nitrospinaceae bacterium]
LLADSEPYHYRAYNEVFQRYGHALDPEEYWVEWTSKGQGIQGEIDRHNLHLGVDREALRRQKFEVYSRFCRNGDILLFPEAKRLGQILASTHKVAIASGSWRHDIQAILENGSASDLFPVILGKESAAREKPDPDIFLKAAEVLDCGPGECLVIEDALKGLTAAARAGMPCVIIRNALNRHIDFPGADLILPSLAEAVTLLES